MIRFTQTVRPVGRQLQHACIALLLAGHAAGATSTVAPQERLLEDLDSFELIAVEVPLGMPEAFSTQIEVGGSTWTLELERVSVWAHNATAHIVGAGGETRVLALNRSQTYRGRVLELDGSWVSAGFNTDGLHAIINAPGMGRRCLQPAGLGDGLTVSFRPADVRGRQSVCEQVVPGPAAATARPSRRSAGGAPIDRPLAPGGTRATFLPPAPNVAELGIDSDFEYFTSNNSNVATTINAIALAMNNVNAAYERDVQITHAITRVIVRTDAASDPYVSNVGFMINDEQAAEWTANQSDARYDLVLHFTGVDTFASGPGFGLIGRAKGIGLVCDRSEAFCFSEGSSNDLSQAQFIGHELGHLWNGRHCNTDPNSNCIGVGPCLLMCGTINSCDNNNTTEFGPCNRDRVIAHRDSRSCLDVAPGDVVWVQFRDCGMTCGENGTFGFPTSSLSQAISQGVEPLTIFILPGSTADAPDDSFPMTIDKHVILNAFQGGIPPAGGVVRIGD